MKQSRRRRGKRPAKKPFALNARVFVKASGEVGTVLGRYERVDGDPEYKVITTSRLDWFQAGDIGAL